MDECEVAGVLQRGGARGRGAEEHRAAESAEEHGLPEGDHRASRTAGRVTLSYVSSLSSVSAGRLHLRSHAIVVHDSVRADCIDCMWYPREETKLCIKDSPRLGPVRRQFSKMSGN